MHPDFNDGVRTLRRGYSFADGNDARGKLDAGLLFIAFVRNLATHFVPLQKAWAAHDSMGQWLTVRGSAVFAVAPGAAADEFIAERLLT
jgi:deferrochelatase/peroxidase EfeB